MWYEHIENIYTCVKERQRDVYLKKKHDCQVVCVTICFTSQKFTVFLTAQNFIAYLFYSFFYFKAPVQYIWLSKTYRNKTLKKKLITYNM